MLTSTGMVAQLVRLDLTVRQSDNGWESQRRPQFEPCLPHFFLPSFLEFLDSKKPAVNQTVPPMVKRFLDAPASKFLPIFLPRSTLAICSALVTSAAVLLPLCAFLRFTTPKHSVPRGQEENHQVGFNVRLMSTQ